MTKINDTTTFPITEPRKEDLVIGTDVSDTGNDANGETVNFELGDILDIADKSSSWHYYDSEFYGDGADGVIFEGGVDANANTITTPDFVDGYEYGLIFDSLAADAGSGNAVVTAVYEGGGSTAFTLLPTNVGTTPWDGFIYFSHPRLLKKYIKLEQEWRLTNSSSPDFSEITPVTLATKSKIIRLTVSQSNGARVFNSGNLIMVRRRDMLT